MIKNMDIQSVLNEKSVSIAQQRFFGMVHKCKKTGECTSKEVKKAAKSISSEEAKKFAKTKHKGLPKKVDESVSFKDFLIEGDVVQFKHKPTIEIQKILKWPIRGDAHHDDELMQLVHDYVMNEHNPMNNRILALKKLDAIIGQPETKVTASDVERYIAQAAEDFK